MFSFNFSLKRAGTKSFNIRPATTKLFVFFRFGDNDTLSALVAVAISADHLFLLSDVDFLYETNPREEGVIFDPRKKYRNKEKVL
jgi:hypothetical protein